MASPNQNKQHSLSIVRPVLARIEPTITNKGWTMSRAEYVAAPFLAIASLTFSFCYLVGINYAPCSALFSSSFQCLGHLQCNSRRRIAAWMVCRRSKHSHFLTILLSHCCSGDLMYLHDVCVGSILSYTQKVSVICIRCVGTLVLNFSSLGL